MFTRIVVGTDGSETAAEAVRQAIDLAKLAGATLSIVSAYAPVSGAQVEGRAARRAGRRPVRDRPARGRQPRPRRRRRRSRKEGIEVQTHPVEGDPAEAILNVAEADQGRPDRGRQQGDDRRPPLPARQRPQQHLPSRSLQRDHRPHDLAARSALPSGVAAVGSVARPRRSARRPAASAAGRGRGRFLRRRSATAATRGFRLLGCAADQRRWRGPSRRRRRRGRPPSRCRRSCWGSPKCRSLPACSVTW